MSDLCPWCGADERQRTAHFLEWTCGTVRYKNRTIKHTDKCKILEARHLMEIAGEVAVSLLDEHESHISHDGNRERCNQKLRAELAAAKELAGKYLKACESTNMEVCQTLGRAIGYPRFCDDKRNFPGSADADGVCVGDHCAESIADEAAKRIAGLTAELAAAKELSAAHRELVDANAAVIRELKAELAAVICELRAELAAAQDTITSLVDERQEIRGIVPECCGDNDASLIECLKALKYERDNVKEDLEDAKNENEQLVRERAEEQDKYAAANQLAGDRLAAINEWRHSLTLAQLDRDAVRDAIAERDICGTVAVEALEECEKLSHIIRNGYDAK